MSGFSLRPLPSPRPRAPQHHVLLHFRGVTVNLRFGPQTSELDVWVRCGRPRMSYIDDRTVLYVQASNDSQTYTICQVVCCATAVIAVRGVGRWRTTAVCAHAVRAGRQRCAALSPSKCSRSMPQHPFFGAAYGGFEACRSMPQHPFFCVHVPVCLAVFFVRRPRSACHVERTFSLMGHIQTKDRLHMGNNTLRHLAVMYVNKPTTDDPDGESD